MANLLINDYLREIDRRRRFSGSSTESVIRGAFEDLLKEMSRDRNLHFVPELEYATALGTRVTALRAARRPA